MVTRALTSVRLWVAAGRWAPGLSRVRFGKLEWAFLALIIVAAAMRLWELAGRTMHYDEAIHLHFSWKLAQGMEFSHSPWMHGPFQIELVALVLKFLGDTDFVARLPYALFGVVLVALPYFLRRQLGDNGAICAAVILAFSPSLLYFSRFGRNDILMAVWSVCLLIFLWRYHLTNHRRYLFGAAVVVALMLASKETAYFVILFMGISALGLGWRQLVALARRPRDLPAVSGAAGFFIFLAALTLPHAAAVIAVVQSPLGLTIAAHDTGSTGITGAPVWEPPFVMFPIWAAPTWLHIVGALALVGFGLAIAYRFWGLRTIVDLGTVAVATIATVAAVSTVVVSPFRYLLVDVGLNVGETAAPFVDTGIGFGLMLLGLAMLSLNLADAVRWRGIALLMGSTTILTWLWLMAFWGGVALVGQLLPGAASDVDLEAGRIAVNYLVPVLALLLLLVVGASVGVIWGGGTWLACAAAFYGIWTLLYTTMFTNWPGVFTGSWQSLGYWLMQQDVARGNQPWYYYFVGLTVYEMIALVFGVVGVVWLLRRREPFGVVLAAWAVATLVIYTVAAEKMPWLLVNITVPLGLVAGMYLGNVADRINWPSGGLGSWRMGLSFVLAPVCVALAVWMAWLAVRGDAGTLPAWLVILVLLPLLLLIAFLLRSQPHAGKAAALGIASLLLVLGVVAAGRAAYTYDDSNLEILAYAQGSADLADTYATLRANVLSDGAPAGTVKADYDMWYPFQWYVRGETKDGSLQFDRFCAVSDKQEGKGCNRVGEDTGPRIYLAEHAHAVEQEDAVAYRREGPKRNLLWYPETYRRPGESRTDTGFWRQLNADVAFFRDAAANREKLQAALEYIIARRQETDWFTADYYQYTRDETATQ